MMNPNIGLEAINQSQSLPYPDPGRGIFGIFLIIASVDVDCRRRRINISIYIHYIVKHWYIHW